MMLKFILTILIFGLECFSQAIPHSPPLLSTLEKSHYRQGALLIDGILSLVKEFYVDRDELTLPALGALLEEQLREVEDAKIFREKDVVRLFWKNRDISVYWPKDISYEQFVSLILRLGWELDQEEKPLEEEDLWHPGIFKILSLLVNGLDPHSVLMTPKMYKDLRQGTEGKFGGIGVVVSIREDILTILDVLADGPAEQGKLKKGDRILKIDGWDTFGASWEEWLSKMGGPVGTQVELLVWPSGEATEAKKVVLTRQEIRIPLVHGKSLKNSMGHVIYISLKSFSLEAAKEVAKIYKNLVQEQGPARGIILDLRGNPGGLLDQAVGVLSLFLEEGVAVQIHGRDREVQQVSGYPIVPQEIPLVVLQDEASASASEIVAGTLQETGRATVLGQRSFGKGSVQTLLDLPGGWALKLTIARYYTPKGFWIQGVGIEPQIVLQPVWPGEKNINLLGGYRFHQESNLRHTLKTQKKKDVRAQLGGYVLMGQREEQTNDNESRFSLDPQIHGALLWLEGKTDAMEVWLKNQEKKVQEFLSSHFDIAWAGYSKEQSYEADLSWKWKDEVPPVWELGALQEAKILVLGGKTGAEGVSVLLNLEERAGGSSMEVLVGNIKPGEEKSVALSMRIFGEEIAQKGYAHGQIVLSVGNKKQVSRVILPVKSVPKAEILAQAPCWLKREGYSQDGGGLCDAQKIRINLKNVSTNEAKDLSVRLVNLSGRPLPNFEKQRSWSSLGAGEETVWEIVLPEKLGRSSLGLVVEGENLPKKIQETLIWLENS